MTKRDIFAEIADGLTALESETSNKVTLRKIRVVQRQRAPLTPVEIMSLRQKMNVSRPVFAAVLNTKPRTVESWEQGRTKPNDQACVLFRLVEKYPDMLERLRSI